MKEYLYRIYFIIAILTSIFYTSSPVDEKFIIIGLIPYVLLVLFVFITVLRDKSIYRFNIKEVYLIGILIFTYIVSSVINRGFSFRELYAVGGIVIGILVCGNIILSNNVKKIIKVFMNFYVYLSMGLSIFGLYCYLTKTEIIIGEKIFGYDKIFAKGVGGILSIMQNVNTYALVCLIAILFSIILMFMSNNIINKLFMVISVIFQSYLLFIMGSRTTLLMLLAFIGFYFIFFYKSKYKKYLYLIGFMIVIILGFMLFTGKISGNSALLHKMMRGDITSGRTELWIAALKGIKENLFFGIGIRNVVQTIGVNMGNTQNILGAHNGYISVLLANGIFVFLSVLSLIVYYIKKSLDNFKLLKGNDLIAAQLMICLILSILVGNITESLLFGDFNFTIVILWSVLIFASKYNGDKKIILNR